MEESRKKKEEEEAAEEEGEQQVDLDSGTADVSAGRGSVCLTCPSCRSDSQAAAAVLGRKRAFK